MRFARCPLPALAAVALTATASAQLPSPDSAVREAFAEWAGPRAQPLRLSPLESSVSDLAPIGRFAAEAKILAFGEPSHGAREPLVMRNRLVKYLVTEQGYRTVALETGLTKSKLLYDHVLNRATASKAALEDAFSYGFGLFPENMELVAWLRDWNAAHRESELVRLYGFDLTGQMTSSAAASVEQVLAYLDRVDPERSAMLRSRFADLLASFTFERFPQWDPARQDVLTGMLEDLLTVLRGRHRAYAATSTKDDYDWALQQARNAILDVQFLRAWPRDLSITGRASSEVLMELSRRAPAYQVMESAREAGMVENLAWIVEREAGRGRVLVFAHNCHLQRKPSSHAEAAFEGLEWAGWYATARFGDDLRIIGSCFGRQEGFPSGFVAGPADPHSIAGLMGAAGNETYFLDLREPGMPPSVRRWFEAIQPLHSRGACHCMDRVAAGAAFDAMIYFDVFRPVASPRFWAP